MAQAIIAAVTDKTRQAFANMLLEGKGFQVTDFVVGSGGHDPGDPVIALTPDPSVTQLPSQTFGPKALSSSSLITPFCPQFECFLDFTEAVGSMSNVGLIATIVSSPIPADPVIGDTFLFAIGNFPLRVKTDSEQLSILVTVQF